MGSVFVEMKIPMSKHLPSNKYGGGRDIMIKSRPDCLGLSPGSATFQLLARQILFQLCNWENHRPASQSCCEAAVKTFKTMSAAFCYYLLLLGHVYCLVKQTTSALL